MLNSEILEEIYKLLQQANESQLKAVLEVLQPSSSRYSQDELNSFYQRTKEFEANGSKGYSVKESYSLIRNNYGQHPK
ncbi:MAG: hypothetical protein ABJB11_15865 [Ferruginibacter sp.]